MNSSELRPAECSQSSHAKKLAESRKVSFEDVREAENGRLDTLMFRNNALNSVGI